jgi:DNA-binding MarR family transcriptional regulator
MVLANGKSVLRQRRTSEAAQTVDYRALSDFRFAIRKFLAFSQDAAASAGLTSRQHQALLTIRGLSDGNGVPIGLLAERLLVRQHTAVELVDRLERSALVRRKHDVRDRRRVLVSLTAKGEQRLGSLSAVHLAELRSMAPALVTVLRQVQTGL